MSCSSVARSGQRMLRSRRGGAQTIRPRAGERLDRNPTAFPLLLPLRTRPRPPHLEGAATPRSRSGPRQRDAPPHGERAHEAGAGVSADEDGTSDALPTGAVRAVEGRCGGAVGPGGGRHSAPVALPDMCKSLVQPAMRAASSFAPGRQSRCPAPVSDPSDLRRGFDIGVSSGGDRGAGVARRRPQGWWSVAALLVFGSSRTSAREGVGGTEDFCAPDPWTRPLALNGGGREQGGVGVGRVRGRDGLWSGRAWLGGGRWWAARGCRMRTPWACARSPSAGDAESPDPLPSVRFKPGVYTERRCRDPPSRPRTLLSNRAEYEARAGQRVGRSMRVVTDDDLPPRCYTSARAPWHAPARE
ncbi:hypothetical protein DFH07DRAFT_779960 [Mycena maculata]|uniref:Uncharacterized protein n=1 Tax=Mycena maculata TaxID=230809 RepID=A0AAD7MWT7_9AGAR|nr:hypothetical protein DFH07DRAFT_779960 [Mycena maculata]